MKSSHQPNKTRCPRCQTPSLESIPRRTPVDHLMKCFRFRPMRCYACEKRCYIIKKQRSVREISPSGKPLSQK